MKPQVFISAVTGNSGKTLFSIGLSHVLQELGMKPQLYKCGPDFIDTQMLSVVSDNEAVNLDVWMTSPGHLQHVYNKYGEQADVCLIEGVGGLFDGYKRMQGSSAEVASLLRVPVILLINARIIGYSVAPVIYGFKNFYAGVHIAGVVFNQVASVNHYMRLREACADVNVDCLGYIPVMENVKMLSRHTAMSVANRNLVEEQAAMVAEQLKKTVDINRLLNKCNRNFPCQYSLPYCSDMEMDSVPVSGRRWKIAVARDSAFNFVYRENMDRLRDWGNIVFFSPLYSSELPEADLVYLPGGYTELFARQLHRRHKMMDALREYAEKGGRILAEGGGLLYLGRTLKMRENGTAYPMSGILPIDFTIPVDSKLFVGYRKMNVDDKVWKGYEFRYSTIQQDDTTNERLDLITNLKGVGNGVTLYRYKNVIASYVHWYWGDGDILKWWEQVGTLR